MAELLIDPSNTHEIFNALNYCHCKMSTVEDKIFLSTLLYTITNCGFFIITMCKLIYSFIYSELPMLSFYCF